MKLRTLKLAYVAAIASALTLPTSVFGFDNHLKVSPGDELMVLPPNVDHRDRPTIQLIENGDGTKRIEVPPCVILHRYYYTGNRDFQGPMLPGGPSVLVMNHPLTGQQISLNAQLMPGAPRIYYTRDSIRYDYGDRVICIHFPLLGHGKPTVVYKRHPAVVQNARGKIHTIKATVTELKARSGAIEFGRAVKDRTKSAFLRSGDVFSQIGSSTVRGVDTLSRLSPFRGLGSGADGKLPSALRSTTGIANELNGTNRILP